MKRGDLYQCVPFAPNGNTLMLCANGKEPAFTRIIVDGDCVTIEPYAWPGKPYKTWKLIGNVLAKGNGDT